MDTSFSILSANEIPGHRELCINVWSQEQLLDFPGGVPAAILGKRAFHSSRQPHLWWSASMQYPKRDENLAFSAERMDNTTVSRYSQKVMCRHPLVSGTCPTMNQRTAEMLHGASSWQEINGGLTKHHCLPNGCCGILAMACLACSEVRRAFYLHTETSHQSS